MFIRKYCISKWPHWISYRIIIRVYFRFSWLLHVMRGRTVESDCPLNKYSGGTLRRALCGFALPKRPTSSMYDMELNLVSEHFLWVTTGSLCLWVTSSFLLNFPFTRIAFMSYKSFLKCFKLSHGCTCGLSRFSVPTTLNTSQYSANNTLKPTFRTKNIFFRKLLTSFSFAFFRKCLFQLLS